METLKQANYAIKTESLKTEQHVVSDLKTVLLYLQKFLKIRTT